MTTQRVEAVSPTRGILTVPLLVLTTLLPAAHGCAKPDPQAALYTALCQDHPAVLGQEISREEKAALTELELWEKSVEEIDAVCAARGK